MARGVEYVARYRKRVITAPLAVVSSLAATGGFGNCFPVWLKQKCLERDLPELEGSIVDKSPFVLVLADEFVADAAQGVSLSSL